MRPLVPVYDRVYRDNHEDIAFSASKVVLVFRFKIDRGCVDWYFWKNGRMQDNEHLMQALSRLEVKKEVDLIILFEKLGRKLCCFNIIFLKK